MAAVCEKDFALHVGASAGLVAYWKFDDAGPPFQEEVDNSLNELALALINPPSSGATGILNDCIRFSALPAGGESQLRTVAKNPLIIIQNGFTFTTWIKFDNLGQLSTCVIVNLSFYDEFDNSIFALRLDIGQGFFPGPGPVFAGVSIGFSYPVQFTFFNPTRAFGSGGPPGFWYLIGFRFDPSTAKIGVRVADTILGAAAGWEESTPVPNDLSSIVKGDVRMVANRQPASTTSQDYRQDESGLWMRLLSDSEWLDLFGGGTPPSYPNLPP